MISLQLDRIRLIQKTISESNAKSAFISSISHELRTPLNSILGFTQYMIVYENLEESQQNIISKIENSAAYLLEMINNILDITKIEVGKMSIKVGKFNILNILEEVIDMLSPLANQKNIEIKFKNRENIFIESDKRLVQQILINLVSNAIKYTKKGYISITLSKNKIVLKYPSKILA